MTPAELLAWRTQAQLSQAGLAAILGVDRQTVYRWEHGERSIPPYLELALAFVELTFSGVMLPSWATLARTNKG